MKNIEAEVIRSFEDVWHTTPDVISKAPGRINIIGEHVDYTGGYVLPTAINRSVVVVAKRSKNARIRGYSLSFHQEVNCAVGDYDNQHPAVWFRYVLGVLSELQKSGYRVSGFDFCLGGDIPIGSGLSSSAALSVAVLTAIECLYNLEIDDKQAALICRAAENSLGVKCGIMDMLVSRVARKDQAVFIDCSDLTWHSVDISLPGYEWIVIDSGKKRELAGSAYNTRVRECENALSAARKNIPERTINSLRDVSIPDLTVLAPELDDTIFRRLRHVVTENARVKSMVGALARRDVHTVGELLYASHRSLRNDYEVSCPELDRLVEILTGTEGVCGARMIGAGFGGCVLALISKNSLTQVKCRINTEYPTRLNIPRASILRIKIAGGAQARCLAGLLA